MKGFKGFHKGLVCEGKDAAGKPFRKEYAENATFEEKDAVICSKGMHFCENPLAVLRFYPPKDGNEYAEVESLAPEKSNDNSKYCTTKLQVNAKISLPALIKAAVKFVFDKKEVVPAGYSSTSASSGDYSMSASSGTYSTSASSGYSSTSASSGNYSMSASSGTYSTSKATGKNSIAVANGIGVKASGVIGCYIVLTEYKGDKMIAKMCRVDGKKIKANTLYTLAEGKIIESK